MNSSTVREDKVKNVALWKLGSNAEKEGIDGDIRYIYEFNSL